ncbi:MAG: type II secretion system protein [Clostridia bacterium]
MKSTLKKTEKGITLVALVVTIVVLLILAGVSINLVLGNNGIIAKAKEAETKSAEASQNDLKGMNALAEEMNNALGEKPKVDLSKYKIGDSVNYTYDPASSSYTLESKYSGYSSNQTIAQTTGLTWKVLNVDKENDTVDIISTNPTSSTVTFANILGYNNGPYLMNEICKAQYSNKTLGVNARSINLLDMEKHLTADGITARNAYQYDSSTAKYGTTKTYPSNTKYPSLYANQKGAGPNITEAEASKKITQPDTTKGNDPYEESKPIVPKGTTEPTNDSTYGTGNPLTVTQTYYYRPINDTNYGTASSILANSTKFWVAARDVHTRSDYATFGLRIADTNAYGCNMFYSNGDTGGSTCALRPVVSLPSRLLTGEQTNGAWNLSK